MDLRRLGLLAVIALFPMGGLAEVGPAARANPQDVPAAEQGDERPGPPPIPVRSRVPAPLTIVQILPNGSRVVKHQLVCEFDPSELKDKLASQQIATERSHAEVSNSKLDLKIAEIRLNEYVNYEYPFELKNAERKVTMAERELRLAWERFKRLEAEENAGSETLRSTALSFVSLLRQEAEDETDDDRDWDEDLRLIGARYAVASAFFGLEAAKKSRELLTDHLEPRQRLLFQADVEKAKAKALESKSRFEGARAQEEELRRYIELCKVYAPADGVIEYRERRIGPDAVVRRGVLIFTLHPDEGAEATGEERKAPKESIFRSLRVLRALPPSVVVDLLKRRAAGQLPDDEIEDLSRQASNALGEPVSPEALRADLEALHEMSQENLKQPVRPGPPGSSVP